MARVLGPLLAERGYPVVAVVGRTSSKARALARRIPGAAATISPERAASAASLLLLAVPDRAIEPLARRLAGSARSDWAGKVVVHHAGALGLEVLRPLERAGASVGRLHPLQVFGRPELTRLLLAGSRATVEGRPGAAPIVRRLARDLGLVELRVPRRLDATGRVAYHAAASLASNDLVALLDAAVEVLHATGVGRRAALQALAPLARGALSQVAASGLGAGLTGPVVRGDVETVRAQLRVLDRAGERVSRIHRLLAARLLELGERELGPLPAVVRRRLERELRSGRAGRRRGRTV